MKDKKVLFGIVGIVIIVVLIGACFLFKPSHFSLEKKYYGKGGLVEISASNVEQLIQDKQSFILFTYNNFCSFSVPCDSIFEEASYQNKIQILQIPFDEFKKTSYYKKVKYAPSVMIVENGKIRSYLDANEDADVQKYQDVSVFMEWLSKYVNLT